MSDSSAGPSSRAAREDVQKVTRYAQDHHLIRRHGDPSRWETYEGCSTCAQIARVRAMHGFDPDPVVKGSLPRICEIPACGCTGEAHP